MLLALLLSLAPSQAQPPEPSCLTAFGETACGYDCLAAFGQVRCAQVPHGACHAAFGTVACGPGSPDRFSPSDWPKATCVAAYGKIACGYGCARGFGEVACASTPWGACIAAYGGVTCTPDDPRVIRASLYGSSIPTSTCVAGFRKRACGWSCFTSRGEAVCARTPWDTCQMDLAGNVHCSSGPAVVP